MEPKRKSVASASMTLIICFLNFEGMGNLFLPIVCAYVHVCAYPTVGICLL